MPGSAWSADVPPSAQSVRQSMSSASAPCSAGAASSADTTIEVEVRASQGGVEISVRDHGVGIPAEDLGHVFEHGFRVTASEEVLGSGVGLRVAQQYAEALGGRIEAVSSEGEGSTFTAWFPDAG